MAAHDRAEKDNPLRLICRDQKMELLEGLPLDDYLDALRSSGRALPPVTTARLMLSI